MKAKQKPRHKKARTKTARCPHQWILKEGKIVIELKAKELQAQNCVPTMFE